MFIISNVTGNQCVKWQQCIRETMTSSVGPSLICQVQVLFYLVRELPQAPCLSVRMLTIFWMSCMAVTWSRYLAARIRWSHILSSSRLSAVYCAQEDWRGKRNKKHEATGPRKCTFRYKPRKCAMFSYMETLLWVKPNEKGHFCPRVTLINNSGHIFTNALGQITPHP